MKFAKQFGPLWINVGWFSGDNAALLNIDVLEFIPNGLNTFFVTIFQIQIGKFVIGFGLSSD